MDIREDYLWVEKFRPHTIEDTILPDSVKEKFEQYVKDGNIPNLLLSGLPGTGKTTVAKALLEMLGCDYIVINGSLDAGIGVIRDDISRFAGTISMLGTRKYVIIDEADGLNHVVQKALRNFIEEYSKNCGFIFTCNFPGQISDALKSRLAFVDFKIAKADKPLMAAAFSKRCFQILTNEGIEFDKKAVMEFVVKHFPDWRRVLNELQHYSATGKIDTGILAQGTSSLKDLMGLLKGKNFTDARKWVAENLDNDTASLYKNLYDAANQYVTKDSVPALVLILAKYQVWDGQVPDKELNFMAALTELMVDCQFL